MLLSQIPFVLSVLSNVASRSNDSNSDLKVFNKMQQVKIFKSVDNELGDLEVQINRWISENKIKILSIHGNIAPQAGKHGLDSSFSAADVLVIVLYEA